MFDCVEGNVVVDRLAESSFPWACAQRYMCGRVATCTIFALAVFLCSIAGVNHAYSPVMTVESTRANPQVCAFR